MTRNVQAPLRIVILVALCASLLAACSGSTGTPSNPSHDLGGSSTPAATDAETQAAASPVSAPASAARACSLLTDGEVSAITGVPVAGHQPATTFGLYEDGCVWTHEMGANGLATKVTLGLHEPGGRSYYDTNFAALASELGFEPVSGLGDAALRDGESDYIAVTGDTLVVMQFFEMPGRPAVVRALVDAFTRAAAH